MNECSQLCNNTFGGFVCSCREGFVLKGQVKCVEAPPLVEGITKPAANDSTLQGSSAAAGGFLWIWIVVAVAVLVLVFVIRFYVVRRQSRRQLIPAQQSTAAFSSTVA